MAALLRMERDIKRPANSIHARLSLGFKSAQCCCCCCSGDSARISALGHFIGNSGEIPLWLISGSTETLRCLMAAVKRFAGSLLSHDGFSCSSVWLPGSFRSGPSNQTINTTALMSRLHSKMFLQSTCGELNQHRAFYCVPFLNEGVVFSLACLCTPRPILSVPGHSCYRDRSPSGVFIHAILISPDGFYVH